VRVCLTAAAASQPVTADSTLDVKPTKRSRLDFTDFEDVSNTADQSSPSCTFDEVAHYLQLKLTTADMKALDGENGILAWWKVQAVRTPRLAAVARFVLAIPASSASSERSFSAAGNTVSSRRSALDPDNVDCMLFLHSNLQ
jgi:hAT family C-terminal dimerisation region